MLCFVLVLLFLFVVLLLFCECGVVVDDVVRLLFDVLCLVLLVMFVLC